MYLIFHLVDNQNFTVNTTDLCNHDQSQFSRAENAKVSNCNHTLINTDYPTHSSRLKGGHVLYL